MERKIVSFEIVWVTVKKYATENGMTVRGVYKRIENGKIAIQQEHKGAHIRVPLRVPKV